MDIDSVADELYSLPPERFTAARGVSEKAAKAIGDARLAAAIRQLRKPSTGAWLANQLVREHSDEVLAFLDLGPALREATTMLSGDHLRELGRQRRQRVHVLMQQARGLAVAAGHKVSHDTSRALEDTLHAALADDRVADQLRAGRLTETLQGAGFSPAPGNRAADQPGPAEREEQRAQAAVRDAAALKNHAQAVADRIETALQQVTGLVSELGAKLAEARIQQSRLEEEHRQSQAELDNAIRAGQVAAQRLDEATQRRGQRSR
ncbi:MAG: hypothetical protein ABIP19_05400 [Dermatophilaceae bacterium]